MKEKTLIYQGEELKLEIYNHIELETAIKLARSKGIEGRFRIEHHWYDKETVVSMFFISADNDVSGRLSPYILTITP